MTYELKITRQEPNPEYKPPKNLTAIYDQRYDVPQYVTFDVLEVEVTEEQFSAIRRAVLEKF